jgi:hypothetical protein
MAESSWVASAAASAAAGGVSGAVALERFCRACVTNLRLGGAAISVVSDKYRSSVFASDAVSARIEELQLTLGEGPCVEATARHRPVLVADLAGGAGGHWPAFTEAAHEAGVAGVYAFPLQVGAIRFGVIDFYRHVAGPLTQQELTDALQAADTAALLMMRPSPSPRQDDEVDDRWWTTQLSADDAVVHQATGWLTRPLGVDAEQAYARLRAYAFAHGRPVSEVARDVIAGRLGLDDNNDHSG